MPDSTITQLRQENDDLRLLVIRLGKIVLKVVVEQTGLPTLHDSRLPLQLPAEISPTEIVTGLRELAVRAAQLSRTCTDGRTTQTLDSLGAEFAVAAEDLEASFAIPAADQPPHKQCHSS
jgi:hypothetical protein